MASLPTDDERRANARKQDGSINMGLGGPGCGKTHWMIRLSLACAYYGGADGKPLPWFAYDANGDVHKHLNDGVIPGEREAMETALRKRDRATVEAKERRLKFLHRVAKPNLFRGPEKLESLLSSIESWIDEGIKKGDHGKLTGPRCVIFMDEAGAIRDKDERFWPKMRMARNAGITIFTTGHRIKDWHPAALACVRTTVLWQHNLFDEYEINGLKIPRSICGVPKGDVLKFIVGAKLPPLAWDTRKGGYPPELITPAYPTVARPAGF